MFGAKNTDVHNFLEMSVSAAVDKLLEELPQPPPPINDYGNDPFVPPGQTWIDAPMSNGHEDKRTYSLKGWWLGNMLDQPTNIREKMVLFWHNHIPIEFWDLYNGRYSYRYMEQLYLHATGNFKALVKAITIDPAMLIYLNNTSSGKDAPDENYARELQELFCVGKGAGAGFTEDDVQSAARVLTGWRTDFAYPETYFHEQTHDTTDKQFSAFYNNTVITGRSGQAGMEELDDLLDMIFATDEVTLFLCRKLYTFFVYQDINEQVEQDIIEPLAQLLRDSNYEVKPVLETLLKSAHFFDPLNRGSMLKSPVEYVVGMNREFHVQFPPASQYQDLFELRKAMYAHLPNMLEAIGDPPNVSGWPAWYQEPIFYKYWITVSTYPKRASHSDLLLFTGYATNNQIVKPDVVAFTATLTEPADPNFLLEEVLRLFYGIEVSDEVKMQLKSILLSGQASDYYWSSAWNEYVGDPNNVQALGVVETRLEAFYQAILQLEEYQLL